jgi:type I site-specific restriction endonuclease
MDTNVVMLLTSAGAAGVDLKGTNNIFFLERPFSYTEIKQIIGRGQRYRSHADLPPSKQIVRVYDFYMRDPKNSFLFAADLIDDIIRNKKRNQEAFEDDLKKSCDIVQESQDYSYLPDSASQSLCKRYQTYIRTNPKPAMQSKLSGFLNSSRL